MASRFSCRTFLHPLSARETVETDTPKCSAMSFIVVACFLSIYLVLRLQIYANNE